MSELSAPDEAEVAARFARFAAREQAGRTLRADGADVRAAASLVVDATKGVMDVVRDMQSAFSPPVIAELSDLVHAAVRGVTGVAGAGVDAALAAVAPALGKSASGREREAVLAALNGVVGDRLALAHSALAIEMSLRPPLDERRQGTLLLFVHGSCMNDLQWTVSRTTDRAGASALGAQRPFDHGRALLRELARDVTLAYVHYNSGRHVKHNGEELAALIERAHDGFDRVMLVCHSMGGLVARSAVHAAGASGHAWRKKLDVLVTLGTPHHGSPLERAGNLFESVMRVTPWTAPIGSLGALRSAGVTDLRFGNVVDADADRFALTPDQRTHAPLPDGVRSYAIAATKSSKGASEVPASELARLADDNLVPVPSALGMHANNARTLQFTETHVVYATDHLGLLASDEVHALLRRWCA
jgi:pimeloyl-ACP methyl ester carboxylesterase